MKDDSRDAILRTKNTFIKEDKQVIFHILSYDKFTDGYIFFFKKTFAEFNHVFVTGRKNCLYELTYAEKDNVYTIDDFGEISNYSDMKFLLNRASKIIISGFFDEKMGFLKKKLLKKTYIHFWGGDFYGFKKENYNGIHGIKRYFMKIRALRLCKAYIFLIDGEYEKYQQNVGIVKKHYTAPMPLNEVKQKYLDLRQTKESKHRKYMILIGNSATKSNHHKAAFSLLERYKPYIEVWVPLSYGDDAYRSEVIKAGKRTFGEGFHPILDFMSKDEYLRFLSNIDVGIFNNDRQQAMGNITSLLALGKKVYIRNDTSMWNSYKGKGYSIFDIDTIKNENLENLISFRLLDKENNERIYDSDENDRNEVNSWKKILYED